MTDRVVLSDDNFTTRDASNNITFSSDRYYVKNDPTGNFFLGGINSTAVLSGFGSRIVPLLGHSGRVLSMSTEFILIPKTTLQLNSGSFEIPLGTDTVQAYLDPFKYYNIPYYSYGLFRWSTSVLRKNGNVIKYNHYINGKFVYDSTLQIDTMFVVDMSGLDPPPNHIKGIYLIPSGIIDSFSSPLLKEGGTYSWSPNYSSYDSVEIINAGGAPFTGSSQPTGTISTAVPDPYRDVTMVGSPLVVSGSPTNVDLKVTP